MKYSWKARINTCTEKFIVHCICTTLDWMTHEVNLSLRLWISENPSVWERVTWSSVIKSAAYHWQWTYLNTAYSLKETQIPFVQSQAATYGRLNCKHFNDSSFVSTHGAEASLGVETGCCRRTHWVDPWWKATKSSCSSWNLSRTYLTNNYEDETCWRHEHYERNICQHDRASELGEPDKPSPPLQLLESMAQLSHGETSHERADTRTNHDKSCVTIRTRLLTQTLLAP